MVRRSVTSARPQRVVGIGASAGGLDPLRQLVARLPLDTGYSFVVLQHLAPAAAGELTKLLAKSTALPVIDAAPGQRVEPNKIYVVPPHTEARFQHGALALRPPEEGTRPHQPIDALFVSLATELHEYAVGVVLSGTGHDGTEGLQAIQEAGGLTGAQEPSTAQFDEMPRSAIAAGVAELVLSPPELADELGMLAAVGVPRAGAADGSKPPIDRVLERLREASGIDFSSYKRTTIERRLARRLAKHQLASLDDYDTFLAEHPDEASSVYEDLLIHVTEFFRDRQALDKLMTHLPELLQGKPAGVPFRVWVPGCSTGEEVYSLAMLLYEALGEGGRPLQLFGSDLSERAIEAARRGWYPEAIAARVGAERLGRFFVREEAGYRIKKEVRERCVFVRHDLVTDPPFSKLDLISCRNVLIYLGAQLQKRVIPIFHYALQQPGFLLLGKAESIAGSEHLFAPIDAEARLFGRRLAAREVITFSGAGQFARQPWRRPSDMVRSVFDVQRDVDHVLLARYGPPCVLVNDQFEVVQFRGRTSAFLEQPPGYPQLNVLRLARDAIAPELAIALEQTKRTDEPVRRERVPLPGGRDDQTLSIEVVPMRGRGDDRHFLVIFEEPPEAVTAATPAVERPVRAERTESTNVSHLRQELAATKEYLHSVVAQHLATSEELNVANEELQSTLEEAQSSNEELQTAKEELQSTNEELETVNEELSRNNKLLHELNDDLINVLASVDLAIIIVDSERKVRRFTPKARAVMKLIPSDIGRPIADLMPSVATPQLDETITRVIETLEVHEAEVCHPDGTWYRMQIRPYRTLDQKINGATISFVDITVLRAAREHAAAIVEAVPTPLLVIDDRLRVQSANRAFLAAFGRPQTGDDLAASKGLTSPLLRARLRDLVDHGGGFEELEIETDGRVFRFSARRMPAADGLEMTLLGIADVTEQRRLQHAREAGERERHAFLDLISHELRTPLSAIVLWAEALRELGPGDPRRAQAITTILDSARAETHLIDDLLELASSADLTVQSESLVPGPVVQAVIDSVRPHAEHKHIAIESKLGSDGAIVMDPRRLRQIVMALISNAVKFTPEGGSVGVDLATNDGWMELRVHNSGPGIPAALVEGLFEPFTRADDSGAQALGGLRIGLSLVRHYVERHGGSIDVDSPGDGHGTTFTVRIPAPAQHSVH